MADFTRAIQLDPENAGYRKNLETVSATAGRLPLSVTDFEDALRLTAEDAADFFTRSRTYYARGVAYAGRGEPELAIAAHDEAIRRDSQVAGYYYRRGLAYRDLGRLERALEDYGEAIRLAPDFANAYASRAVLLTTLGRDAEARQDGQWAVELGFQSAVLRNAIGDARDSR